MNYKGPERRKHPRIQGRFIVSYRIADNIEKGEDIDYTQTKDLSLGGMMLTTNKPFVSNTRLILELRLPFDPYPIIITGRVIESREITQGLIYDTRLEFLEIQGRHKKILTDTVDYYLKKG